MSTFTDEDRQKLTEVHVLVTGSVKRLDDHEVRIRSNEKSIHTMWAWAGALGVAATVAWDYLKGKVFG